METETNQWRQDNLCANTSVVFFFLCSFSPLTETEMEQKLSFLRLLAILSDLLSNRGKGKWLITGITQSSKLSKHYLS